MMGQCMFGNVLMMGQQDSDRKTGSSDVGCGEHHAQLTAAAPEDDILRAKNVGAWLKTMWQCMFGSVLVMSLQDSDRKTGSLDVGCDGAQ